MILTDYSAIAAVAPTPPTPVVNQALFAELVSNLPSSRSWCVLNVDLSGLPTLLDNVSHGAPLLGISDGSFKNGLSTAHWILQIPGCPASCIQGSCSVPSHPDDQSAYRAELGGMDGLFNILSLLISSFRLSVLASCSFGCDNDAVRKQIGWPEEAVPPLTLTTST